MGYNSYRKAIVLSKSKLTYHDVLSLNGDEAKLLLLWIYQRKQELPLKKPRHLPYSTLLTSCPDWKMTERVMLAMIENDLKRHIGEPTKARSSRPSYRARASHFR